MKSPISDCADVQQNLHLLLGGELDSAQERRQTEEHLSECAACRLALEGARRSRELYLAAAVDTDSEDVDLWPGIRSRLYSEQILTSRSLDSQHADALSGKLLAQPSNPPISIWRRLAPLGTAVAAAAVILISLPFLDEGGRAPLGEPESPVLATPVAMTADQTTVSGSELVAEAEEAAASESLSDSAGLRPILITDESLLERERRLQEEQLLSNGSGQGVLITHPFEPLYDVVNQRRLR